MGPAGRFIAIEGTDGSGKTTQFERLILSFPDSIKVGTLDFPRYGEPSAYFVEKYLKGRYGSEVGPYTSSLFYGIDRFDARLKMLQWLEEGRVVIANRYVASNMAHQGAKIADKTERWKFYEWLHQLEYETLAIPKPDLNIILHVPAQIARELIEKRGRTKDIHEEDIEHQKRAEEAYLEIAALYPNEFRVIKCAPQGKLLPPEVIHGELLELVKKNLGTF